MAISRRLTLIVVGITVVVLAFAYGVLVGARQYPPYHAIQLMFGNSSSIDQSIYETIDPKYRETDPAELILLDDADAIDTKRSQLQRILWQDDQLPLSLLPEIESDVEDAAFEELANLDRIDRLVFTLDFGIESICYHFIPKRRNGDFVLYHQGHRGGFDRGKRVIQELVAEGFDVVGIAMPLRGMNDQTVVNLPHFGRIKIEKHQQISFLVADSKHPIRFFLEPTVGVVNYAESRGFNNISMVGFSGGGWAATLAAAVDPRIDRSYSVAGGLPFYLRSEGARDWGDYEQTDATFYRIANYLELYVLACCGDRGAGRDHVQIFNKYDSCCFAGIKYTTYQQAVANAVKKCGAGRFDVLLDESHREHKISEWAMKQILDELVSARAE